MHSTDCLHRMLVSNLISLDHEKLWTAYGMGNCWSNSAKAVFLEVEADHMRSSRNRTLWDSWRSTWSPGTWRWMKDWSKSNKMQEVLEAESWNQGSVHGLGLQGLVVFFLFLLHLIALLLEIVWQDSNTTCELWIGSGLWHWMFAWLPNVNSPSECPWDLGDTAVACWWKMRRSWKLRRTMLWKVKTTASA